MRKLLVALGDAGCTSAIVPVLTELQMSNLTLGVYADPNGMAGTILDRAGLSFVEMNDISDSDLRGCDLLWCGTSAKATTLFRNATYRAQRLGVPVVWLEDFYLTSCDGASMLLTPDHLTWIIHKKSCFLL